MSTRLSEYLLTTLVFCINEIVPSYVVYLVNDHWGIKLIDTNCSARISMEEMVGIVKSCINRFYENQLIATLALLN